MDGFLKVLFIILMAVVVLFMLAVVFTVIYTKSRVNNMRRKEDVWEDRKRNWLGLPWTFTRYGMDKERLFIDKGFLNTKSYEVRLYRITDVSLERSLWQKIIGTGTVLIHSSDRTLGNFKIRNIKNSFDVKELISGSVEKQREAKRVYTRENMVESSGGDEGFDDDENDAMSDV